MPPVWVQGTQEAQGSSGDLNETWYCHNFWFHITTDFQKLLVVFILVEYPKGHSQRKEVNTKIVCPCAALCLSGTACRKTRGALFPIAFMMLEHCQ